MESLAARDSTPPKQKILERGYSELRCEARVKRNSDRDFVILIATLDSTNDCRMRQRQYQKLRKRAVINKSLFHKHIPSFPIKLPTVYCQEVTLTDVTSIEPFLTLEVVLGRM